MSKSQNLNFVKDIKRNTSVINETFIKINLLNACIKVLYFLSGRIIILNLNLQKKTFKLLTKLLTLLSVPQSVTL